MPRQHQDGDGDSPSSDALTDVDAAEVRQVPIQDDQVGGGFGSAANQSACSIRSNINVVSLNIKLQSKQISQFVFIVNKKDTETGLGFQGHPALKPRSTLGIKRTFTDFVPTLKLVVLRYVDPRSLDGRSNPSTA